MQKFIDMTYHAAIYLGLSKEDGDFSQLGERKKVTVLQISVS